MKLCATNRIAIVTAVACLVLACQSAPEDEPGAHTGVAAYDAFGAPITPDGAVDVTEVLARADQYEDRDIKVAGVVSDVCQKKGCWMTLEVGDGEDVMVRFKDYGFFVPKDCAGREVVLEGKVRTVERSVEHLRHLAKDAGRPPEEIAAISEPQTGLEIEAAGVLMHRAEL